MQSLINAKYRYLYLLAGLAFILSAAASYAQITRTARVELGEEKTAAAAGHQIYVTPDPERKLNAQIILMRHQNNLRGQRSESEIIAGGIHSHPSWLTFSVANNTPDENWVLSFGNTLTGRVGFAKALQIYDDQKNQIIESGGFRGAGFPLMIKSGETKIFTIYREPEAGFPATIKPRVLSHDRFFKTPFYSPSFLVILGFVLFAGFFVSLYFIRSAPVYLFFAGYYGLQALLLFSLSNWFLVPVWAAKFILGLFFLTPGIALFLTKRFLNITVEDHRDNVLIFSGLIVLVLCALANIFFMGPRGLIDDLFLYTPALMTWLCTAFIGFSHGNKGYQESYYFALACLMPLIGLTITMASALDLFVASSLTLGAYWYFLLFQAALFAFSCTKRIRGSESETQTAQMREERTARHQARLQYSRESADQARLLRVIERERELMAELREREMLRTEEMRRAKDIADEANRAKSAFLAVVSHEIRTPMTGILGMVRLLKDTKLGNDQKDYVLAIQKSGDTMLALLNDILDFEKIESGNMDLELIDFDLPKLVRGVVTLMSGYADDKSLQIKTDIPASFPQYVIGDPTRLRQVLLNLVSNALKFTHEGHVAIRLSAEKQGKAEDYDVTFEVEDTGIGINKSAQKHLFSPFSQADNTVSRKYGGTGLGLAICQRLVEAMGGKMTVQSEEGEGSLFSFTIRMKQGSESSAETFDEALTGRDTNIPPQRILVIEDNQVNRRVLQGFLEKDNHKVTLVGSGEEGLKALEKHKFDAVLSDINLKTMSGIDIIGHIRQSQKPGIADIPVIAITGNITAGDIEEYYSAGFNGYLEKPVDPAKLEDMLHRVYTGNFESFYQKDAPAPGKKTIQERKPGPAKNMRHILDEPDEVIPPASSETTPPVPEIPGFNAAMLEGLRTTLSPEDFKMLVESFLEKTDEIVRTLQTEEKLTNIRDRAHELKGMAANFGGDRLSRIAGDIEKAAKEQNLKGALEKIERLPAEAEAIHAVLSGWIKKTD